ncbi:MAG: ABC transporter ATP-binding protein [Planctomycetota bacterium]|nr:ABC transporter ATP-binding protein/permease [Planctomycetota bacterium]MDW8372925.1 ABC transporter ATP-binding protein [Planctomycetota bacterium]
MTEPPATASGYRLIRAMVLRRPRLVAWIVVLAFLVPLISAPVPYLGKVIIDELVFRERAESAVDAFLGVSTTVWMLAGLVLLGVLLKLLSTVLGGWHTYDILQITRNGLHDVRLQVAERVMGVPMRTLETLAPGAVAARLTHDPHQVDGAVFTVLRHCLTAGFTIVVVTAFMLAIDPFLTLVVLATMPLTALWSLAWYRRLRDFSREESDRTAALAATSAEAFTAMKTIRACAAERAFLERIRARCEALRYEGIRHWTVYHTIGGLLSLLSNLGADIFLFVGGLLAMQGRISFGEFFAFAGYQAMLWGPINTLLTTGQALQAGAAGADKLAELAALPQEPHRERAGGLAAERLRGEIVFEGVRFSYDGVEEVLRDITLSIRPGTMTALVGASGSGKTTLANLVLGFYLPTAGRLTIDGIDIRAWDLARLRAQCGVVLQDAPLFDDTLRANLVLGEERWSEAEIWAALRAAHLDAVVRGLPQGLETRIGQAGVRLSGGQRQRLAIARVFLRDPRLVILDEATSALDSETERQIQRSFDALLANRTAIVIAHRLSTVHRADQIVVLHGGRIVEIGTHGELVARRDGRYRELYEAQVEGMLPMSGPTRSHREPT